MGISCVIVPQKFSAPFVRSERASRKFHRVCAFVLIAIYRWSRNFCRHRLARLLDGQPLDPVAQDQPSRPNADDTVSLTTPARLRRIGREMRMLVDGPDNENVPDPSLLRFIARTHEIQERLCQDTNLTVRDIAREEGITSAYIYTPAASAARAGYHHGDRQGSTTATADRQIPNAAGIAVAPLIGLNSVRCADSKPHSRNQFPSVGGAVAQLVAASARCFPIL